MTQKPIVLFFLVLLCSCSKSILKDEALYDQIQSPLSSKEISIIGIYEGSPDGLKEKFAFDCLSNRIRSFAMYLHDRLISSTTWRMEGEKLILYPYGGTMTNVYTNVRIENETLTLVRNNGRVEQYNRIDTNRFF